MEHMIKIKNQTKLKEKYQQIINKIKSLKTKMIFINRNKYINNNSNYKNKKLIYNIKNKNKKNYKK